METLWPKASASRELSAGSVEVWAVRLSDGSVVRALQQVLTADERERAERFAIDEPRNRFVRTRAALRSLLGQHLNLPPQQVPLEVDANGKPRLSAGPALTSGLSFNVAHGGALALIAISSAGEVGVDVEQVRPVEQTRQIAEKHFHAQEMAAIVAAKPAVRDATFLRYWTAKEAVLKAVGTGITGSLSHSWVPADASEGAWIELPALRCWLKSLQPADGYAAAVACVNAKPNIHCYELDHIYANGERG